MGILRTDVIAHSKLTSANASVLFDGGAGATGSTGLRTADGDDGYKIGSENESITIECWIYPTLVSQTFDTIFATNSYGVSGVGLILYNNNDGLYWSATGFASDYTEYGIIEVNTWYHVAMVKEKKQFRLYLDGVCKSYRESTSDFAEDQLCIGCSNYGSGFPTYSFKGNISNFRVVKKALYKENFTPSKFKLKNITGTTLLCCQDSADDTTAAVGSISAGGSPTPSGLGPDLKEDTTDTGVVFGDNTKFDTQSYMVPPTGATTQRGRGRAVLGGGYGPTYQGGIQYMEMSSGGKAINFGELYTGRYCGGSSSDTRGLFLGGEGPGGTNYNIIDYVTIATTSNSVDFGDLTTVRRQVSGLASSTRGVFGAGYTHPANSDVIDYATIATLGNATDFGNVLSAGRGLMGASSPTRGVWGGGAPGPTSTNVIQYVTIATTGNATDFGDLTVDRRAIGSGAVADTTRAVFIAGNTNASPSNTMRNTIDYVTIATTGNATDFGDATAAKTGGSSISNSIIGIYGGGYTPSYIDNVDSITIQTTGNAVSHGNLTQVTSGCGNCSDSHGGIS